MATRPWIVITGGGSGIGRALAHHYSRNNNFRVLTCGRRGTALTETRETAPDAESIHICECDISCADGRAKLSAAIPADAEVALLVQNAAIGDPARGIKDIDIEHFEESLKVNVVAPLALSQAFLERLTRGKGRIIHLGTGVAHRPQPGTATYGVTKLAFHRLYQQLSVELDGVVPVGSLSPGMVDTEGVRDHVAKARKLALPHVQYFDQAFEQPESRLTPMAELMECFDDLLAMDAAEFGSKEWRFSEWRASRR